MTKLLKKAFQKASTLPESEQDALAKWLLDELEDDQKWDDFFANADDKLDSLVAEAISEQNSGKTRPLDPKEL